MPAAVPPPSPGSNVGHGSIESKSNAACFVGCERWMLLKSQLPFGAAPRTSSSPRQERSCNPLLPPVSVCPLPLGTAITLTISALFSPRHPFSSTHNSSTPGQTKSPGSQNKIPVSDFPRIRTGRMQPSARHRHPVASSMVQTARGGSINAFSRPPKTSETSQRGPQQAPLGSLGSAKPLEVQGHSPSTLDLHQGLSLLTSTSVSSSSSCSSAPLLLSFLHCEKGNKFP